MIFYFERATGKRVSQSTWTRSHAQGGTRFVRRSFTPRESEPGKGPTQAPETPKAPAPAKGAPKTSAQWDAYVDAWGYGFEDQGEVDSGTDYGEE